MVATPTGGILTVMAHPDDAELWAGGTLAVHAAAGVPVAIAVPGLNPTRRREAVAGARLLGATPHLLDAITVDTVRDLLVGIQPDVVITHNLDDIHPDHQQAAQMLLTALPDVVISTGKPHAVYTCDSYHNLDRHGHPLHLPTIIDITPTWRTKITALAVHQSQPITEHFGPMAETLARLHGGRAGVQYAEAFAPVPVLGRLPTTPLSLSGH
ncbi:MULTISPECIES: PIG-L deacetylase family protein [unclassified Micromonospora]|uniref:PIG-L deacetylase family protein n=1 Tax=unclassified Micromonospora TaxID=2617518 RepID=UPI003A8C5C99